MRAIAHYLSSFFILVFYNVQVCPFLESLTPLQLGAPLIAVLIGQWLMRGFIYPRMVDLAPYATRVQRALVTEFGLFLGFGVTLAVFNALVYGAPMESGLKVVLGFVSLGFFVSVDLSLEQERKLVLHFRETGQNIELDKSVFPVSRKLLLFAAISAVLATFVLFLVVNKDLLWLLDVSDRVPLVEARRSILNEFIFVALVILAHILNVIHSYANNLRLFFENESSVLERTNSGDLSGRVPVSSRDEFGVIAHHTNLMVRAIEKRTHEIQRTQDVTILSLASLAETRDNETGAHILRTQGYVRALAEHLSRHDRFKSVLSDREIDLLFKSAPLHDIGKVGIPDAILLKPGKLTDDEFAVMKTHASLGGEALRVAERELGSSSFLRYAREIAETHHEKWDGSGYPRGLKGDAIPLSGRLMAVADVYDALISKRVYKPAFSHEKAKGIILEGRGGHFDPDVVDAFVAVENKFLEISRNLQDEAYAA